MTTLEDPSTPDDEETSPNSEGDDTETSEEAPENVEAELVRLADSGEELTEETLQQKLQDYHKRFEQEFRLSIEDEPDKVYDQTMDFFKKEVPDAAAQIVWLAHNAESETVRAGLLKFIVAQGMSDAKKAGDPIKKLIAELSESPKKAAAYDSLPPE